MSKKLQPRFIDNDDGTITDTTTRLMWTKETLACGPLEHTQAIKACKSLRLARRMDWRLPSIKELFSLVDHSKAFPAIDTAFFPDAHCLRYWASTLSRSNSLCGWVVDFKDGQAYITSLLHNCYVRAVRAPKP